jgi:hypothetical protein
MLRTTPLVTLLAAALALAVNIEFARATPLGGAARQHNPLRSVTIANNRGGYVVDYARQVHEWRRIGTRVRFAGRCESACTLYLALPASQTCIARGASFSFHAPRGGTPNLNRVMAIYMTSSYPGWVQSWLKSRGGLSRRLVTMNYQYASRFMRPCATASASTEVRKAGKTG